MRYTQLRAFHQVALHGGFSRAAQSMNQSQPSLSEQVRQLEKTHDFLLFTRENKRVALTKAGEQLFLLTRQFFESEDNIAAHLQASRAAVSGTLRIIADSAVHVTKALHHFRTDHPDVLVDMRTGNSAEVLQALRTYDADIGILGSPADAPDLTAIVLGSSPVIAIAAREFFSEIPTHLSLAELGALPLIFRERGSHTQAKLITASRDNDIILRPVIEVEGREAMRELVASGLGIGFVCEAEIGADDRLARISIGVDSSMAMTETLVHMSVRQDVPMIRAFIKAVSH
ncbi:LysR substrate-binding domain-containing protein [Alphaproteobacteria bacterium]|jgi:aminoethylphosphonate catabolism LysR family transcriptional regulator|nr:LysR substrate-binding domain-containing protein [Alphaproteobacteria bacterium]